MKILTILLLAGAACVAEEARLGKPLQLASPVPIDLLTAKPDHYVGKTVQVRGKVSEVCQMMGCWMQLVDPASGKGVRVKVNDGEISFPKDAAGRVATAEGKWVKIKLTREQAIAQAKHEAEEQGRPFRPDKAGPAVFYQIQGTGAVVEGP